MLGERGAGDNPVYTFAQHTGHGMYATGGGPVLSASNTWRLYVNGTTGIQSNGVPFQSGADGSPSSPAFSFTADTDVGMYRPTTNQVGLAAGGVGGLILGSSGILSANIYNSTTGSGANVHIDSGHRLWRSTSSSRYKANIKKIDESRVRGILSLSPSEFDAMTHEVGLLKDGTPRRTRKGEPIFELKPTGERLVGLIAEDVHENFPEACLYDEEGKPDAIDWNAITAALILEVQELHKQLAEFTTTRS
jgi:hypothetical protein